MDTLTLIIVLILLNLFLIVLIVLFMQDILKIMTKRCDFLGDFIIDNSGFFKIFFTFAFFLEQVAIILFINWFFDLSNLSKWMNVFIGIVALIVVTTAYFQAFIWEYKYQASQKDLGIFSFDYERMRKDVDKLIEENIRLIDENEQLRNRVKK